MKARRCVHCGRFYKSTANYYNIQGHICPSGKVSSVKSIVDEMGEYQVIYSEMCKKSEMQLMWGKSTSGIFLKDPTRTILLELL